MTRSPEMALASSAPESARNGLAATANSRGSGIGIVAEVAVRDFKPVEAGGDLAIRPMGHLFGQNITRVAFRRGAYLRNFVYKFAELVSDRLNRNVVSRAMTGHVNDYEL